MQWSLTKANFTLTSPADFRSDKVKEIGMKSKSASEWVRAFSEVFQKLTSPGFKPKLQTMDNETSAALKNYFTEQDMTQRSRACNSNFQRALCCRFGISGSRLPNASVGPFFASS
jgi:hypothetical protein